MQVTSFNRAKDAFEHFTNNYKDLDLLITDLRMPEMSGQQLILSVRDFEKNKGSYKVPIIVLTAEASSTEKVACLSEYGADAFLLKPSKLSDLVETVERLVTTRRLEKKKFVLLIDDDVISQKLITCFIKKAGHHPVACRSIAEAKREFESNPEKYDVIFLDSQLQDGTGLDFMQFYSRMADGRNGWQIPIISMSGNQIPDQQRMYGEYQLHAFLEKPVSKSKLLSIIESIEQGPYFYYCQ
eukprot:TRINITY_DN121329_c0_g1_i1.p2 TRINITY_DN121329_c0_g1~~TRINITY_DN121329_c0_g1_i1.p2  ORF type:complete len:241 (+),score=23.81 TRINITY_DN121329_c0_g1_i1:2063-2785(+)